MFTKAEKWCCFILFIYLSFTKGEEVDFKGFYKYSRLIVNVSIGLKDRYSATCGNILRSNNPGSTENRTVQILVKELASDIRFDPPVLAASFKNYVKTSTQKTNQPRCVRRLFIILGWFEDASRDFAEMSRAFQMRGSIWVIFLHRNQNPSKFLEKVNTPFNTDLILAKMINTEMMLLDEAYRVGEKYPLRIFNYGSYINGKLTFPKFFSLYSRRYDMEGFPVRLSTRDDFPICGYYWDEKGQKRIGGYFGSLIYELAQKLNFTPVHIDAKENITGLFVDGKWSGLVGMLERNEIDLAAGPMAVDRRALPVSDYVRPLVRTTYQVFFKPPGDIIIWDAILRPFATFVWYLILGSIFFCAICLHFFYRIGVLCNKELETSKEEFSTINSIFIFLKAFSNQASAAVPDSWPCRLLFITGYLTSTVLVTAYSAALISHLTTSKPIRPFDSLESLLKDGTYSLAAIHGTTDYAYFANASDPLHHDIYQKLMKKIPLNDLPKGKEDGMEQVCYLKNRALFVTYVVAQITARQYNEEHNCTILQFTNHLDKTFLTIGRRKNFPFAELIEYYVQIMESSGILKRLQKSAWPLERKTSRRSYREVTLEKVIQIHAVLIIGMFLSFIVFLIEVIYFNYQNRKESTPDSDMHNPAFIHKRLFFSNDLNYLNYKKHDEGNSSLKYRKKISFMH